jgi:hypothetical protein
MALAPNTVMVIARRNLPTCRMVARLVVIDRGTAASLASKAGDRQPDGQGRKHHVTGRRDLVAWIGR